MSLKDRTKRHSVRATDASRKIFNKRRITDDGRKERMNGKDL